MSKFISAVLEGGASPIPFEELHNTSLATLKAVESIRTHASIAL